MYVAAAHPGNIIRFYGVHAHGSQLCNQAIVISAPERGMRLLCWTKVLFYSKMNLDQAAFKPASSAL
jgi:hypothetical protein